MATVGGLFWYEIVLLVLGAVLFFVLLGALRSALAAGKSYVGLLPFFLLSIVMMGYPSIKSVQYKDGMVQIDNDTAQIEKNPGDPQNTARRQALEAKLNQFASRAAGEQDMRSIARARAALKPRKQSEEESGGDKSGKPAQSSDQPSQGQSSQNTKELLNKVTALTKEAQAHPKTAPVRTQLTEAVRQLKISGGKSPEEAAAIKNAEELLGHAVN